MPTFAINFSRPGAQVAGQYYEFVRLGREGYLLEHGNARKVAMYGAQAVAELGPFRLVSDGSELPVFTFTTNPDVSAFDVFDVSRRMREGGWLVPAYTFPANREDLAVLRVVVRRGGKDMAELFLNDLRRLIPELERQSGPLDTASKTSFHH
jgi:glutamate decarboxylase